MKQNMLILSITEGGIDTLRGCAEIGTLVHCSKKDPRKEAADVINGQSGATLLNISGEIVGSSSVIYHKASDMVLYKEAMHYKGGYGAI